MGDQSNSEESRAVVDAYYQDGVIRHVSIILQEQGAMREQRAGRQLKET